MFLTILVQFRVAIIGSLIHFIQKVLVVIWTS